MPAKKTVKKVVKKTVAKKTVPASEKKGCCGSCKC